MIKDLNVIWTKYRLKCNRANLNFLVILEHRTVFKELTRRDFRFATVSWSCSIIALNHFLTCSLCLSLSLHFCPCVNAGSGCVDEVQYHAAYVLVTYYYVCRESFLLSFLSPFRKIARARRFTFLNFSLKLYLTKESWSGRSQKDYLLKIILMDIKSFVQLHVICM